MDFPEKLLSLRNRLGLTQEEMGARIGLSSNYISTLEKGSKTPSDAVVAHIDLLERAVRSGLFAAGSSNKTEQEESAPDQVKQRTIPVLGWAHAGEAATYEEIPPSWQERVPTDCQDPQAFGVRLEGESMEPDFKAGDLLVLMPNRRPYSGILVVAKMRTDGLIFRRLQILESGRFRLIPKNPAYSPTEHDEDEFAWIAPVWGTWRQVWR